MQEIYVKREQIAAIVAATFPEYTGSKFQVRPSSSVHLIGLNWDEGSRSQYRACTLSGMATGNMDRWNQVAPSRNKAEGATIEIPAGAAVVEHCTSRGKSLGLTVYIRPDEMPPALAAPVELGPIEKLVLRYTKTHKASYGGRDRYQMAREDAQAGFQGSDAAKFGFTSLEGFPSRADWEAAKAQLTSRKLLNKAGAITIAGKNAI